MAITTPRLRQQHSRLLDFFSGEVRPGIAAKSPKWVACVREADLQRKARPEPGGTAHGREGAAKKKWYSPCFLFLPPAKTTARASSNSGRNDRILWPTIFSDMRFFSIAGLVVLVALQSCIVSKKKFDDMLAQKVKAEGELAEQSKKLVRATADIDTLSATLAKLKKDTANLGIEYRTQQHKLNELEKEYGQLNSYYKNLLNSSGKLNRDLTEQREQLLTIQANLERTRRLNDSLSTGLMEREKKVKELETVLSNKDKAVKALKDRIANSLLNFKESDLTVNVKNGKVYVSLAEQLLFGSGSIEVDAKGVTALQQLARAIRDQRDIQIMVEGHTDNVPISRKSQYMNDNWDLSVLRATSITKILTRAGVAPNQITSAGKGEFYPLGGNDTPANRAKNRRTEIIITPNLDELFKILEAN